MGQEHNINPNQLTMFERAGDLADHEQFYPDNAYQAPMYPAYKGMDQEQARGAIREDNLKQSLDSGLYSDIAENGIKNPVQLTSLHRSFVVPRTGDLLKEGFIKRTGMLPSRGRLQDGHHRVYSQADIDPNKLVPVEWDKPVDPLL